MVTGAPTESASSVSDGDGDGDGDGAGPRPEHVDVLVVGAGLSGIGAAYRLQTERPRSTYAILEARDASGGTWDLFRYPGVRSDSDMFTLGYPFRPWTGSQTIAEGPDILAYLRETAAVYGIDRKIRYGQKVVAASWDSSTARWTVTVLRRAGGDRPEEPVQYTCGFLYLCTGYYSYDGGYRPELAGLERYRGEVVHPQSWPEKLDYSGQRVVVVGSGATAITLVPAMAETAAHVTMVQRSPTYVISLPRTDPVAARLDRALPAVWSHRLARWKSVVLTQLFYLFCRRRPRAARRLITAAAEKELPAGYPVDPDFTPTYDPWDQRMCVVPDGDLFASIREGRSSIVTGRIETFTESGLRMESGEELDADLVVLATGLHQVPWGEISVSVDGAAQDPATTLVYRGCLLGDVPNLAFCVGYVNASWTLRADLSSRYVCRLLNYMERHGYDTAVPRPPDDSVTGPPVFNLSAGYIERTAAFLPKQGTRDPWRFSHNYPLEFLQFQMAHLTTDMVFSRSVGSSPSTVPAAAVAP